MESMQKTRLYLMSALLLGVAADWLLFGQPLGIGLLLFTLLGLGLLYANGRVHHISPIRRNLWLVVPLLFFATMAFVRANPLLTLLNVTAVVALLAFVAFFYAAGRVSGLGVVDTAVLPVRAAAHSLAAPVPLGKALNLGEKSRLVGHGQAAAVVRGGLLALPVLLVFTLLLTAADLVFASQVERLLALDFLPNLTAVMRHALLIGASGWLFGGGIVFALAQHGRARDESILSTAVAGIPRRVSLGFGETATILVLVNALFLTFCVIQAVYLFGGVQNVGLEGFSYAEYARRGFFELVTTAVLALGLILGLNWLTRRENKRQLRWFNLLSSVTVGLVLLLLVSAWRRMALYEAAFGSTELRLFVFTAMAWLAVLLVWFGVTLWRRPDRFALGCLVVAMGFVATLNLLNPDALIVERNMARYAETGDLDVWYLARLSDDAVVALTAVLPTLATDSEPIVDWNCRPAVQDDTCETTRHAFLTRALQARYDARRDDTDWRRWQALHIGRSAAFGALDATFGDGS